MGTAVFLFMWCIRCQTKRNGGAFVLGGMPLTYAEIEKRSGFKQRKVRRWLETLRKFNYVKVTYLNYMKMKIEVMKSKKWAPTQTEFSFGNVSTSLTENGQGVCPKTVKGSTKNGQPKQSCSLRDIKASELPSLSVFSRLGITLSLWTAFKGMREKIFRPIVPGAEDLIAQELIDLQAKGEDPVKVIEQAIKTASFMLYPVRKGGANNGHESFHEKRSRTTGESIAAILPDGVSALAGDVRGTLPPASQQDIRRMLPGESERSKRGGTRRGVSARAEFVGVHADSRDDPERVTRSPVDRGDAIDVDPVSGSESGGKGDRSGSSEKD